MERINEWMNGWVERIKGGEWDVGVSLTSECNDRNVTGPTIRAAFLTGSTRIGKQHKTYSPIHLRLYYCNYEVIMV